MMSPLEEFNMSKRKYGPMSVLNVQRGTHYPSMWTEMAIKHN